MTVTQRAIFGIAVLAEAIGILFLVMAMYFYLKYLNDGSNPLRHEYLFGVSLGLLSGTGSFVAASVVAVMVRRHVMPLVFRLVALPGLVAAVLFALLLVFELESEPQLKNQSNHSLQATPESFAPLFSFGVRRA